MITDKVYATDVTKLRQGIDDVMSNVETWLVEQSNEIDTGEKKAVKINKRHSYHGKDRLNRCRRRKNVHKVKDDKLFDNRRNTVDGDCGEKFVKDVLLNTDYKEIVSELDTFMKTYFEDIYSKVRTLPFPVKEADLELTLEVCVALDDPAQSNSSQLGEKSTSCISLYCNDSDSCLNNEISEDTDILKDEERDFNDKENSIGCIAVRHNESKTELRRNDDSQQEPNLNGHSDLHLHDKQESDTNAFIVDKIEDSGICVSNEKRDQRVSKKQGQDERDSMVIVDIQYEDMELCENDLKVGNDENVREAHNEESEGKQSSRPKSVVFGEVDIMNANLDSQKVDVTSMCPSETCIGSLTLPLCLATDSNSKQEKIDKKENGSNVSTNEEGDSYICLTSRDFEDLKECLNVQGNDILHTSCLEATGEKSNKSNTCLNTEQSTEHDPILSVIYEKSTVSGSNVTDQEDEIDSDTLTDTTPDDDLDKCFPRNPVDDLNTRVYVEQVGISTQERVLESTLCASGGEGNLSLGFSTDEQTYDSSTCESFQVTEDSSICSSGKQTHEREDAVLATNSTFLKLESTNSNSHTISDTIQSDEEDTSNGKDTKVYDSSTSFEVIDDWNADMITELVHHSDACNTLLHVSDRSTHLKDPVLQNLTVRRKNERDSALFSSFEVLAEPNTIRGIEKVSDKNMYLDIKEMDICNTPVQVRHMKGPRLIDGKVMDNSASSMSRGRLDDHYMFSSFEHLDENNNFYFRRTRECDTSACSSFVHLDDPDIYLNAKNVEDSGISLSPEKAREDSRKLMGGHGEKKHHRNDCLSSGDEYRLATNPRRRIRLDSRERNKRKFKKKGKPWFACAPFLCAK